MKWWFLNKKFYIIFLIFIDKLCKRFYNNNRLDSLAQSVEHLTFNQGVPGSSPGWITIRFNTRTQYFIVGKRFVLLFERWKKMSCDIFFLILILLCRLFESCHMLAIFLINKFWDITQVIRIRSLAIS